MDAARDVSCALEAAIDRGEISIDRLLSDRYDPIPGTDPVLHSHPAQRHIVPAARAHQEQARRLPGFFGMTFTDRNAFGAVAMPERAQPQRPGERTWNDEHARQGMIFQFPETQEQCQTTAPFCLKAYRRQIAGGGVVLLKQVIASIHVHGRHWGILQLAYEDQG